MKRITVSSLAAVALVVALSSASESTALAAQRKRPCSCTKATARKARPALSRAARARAAAASYNSGSAAVVGPVLATYTLEQNQYFRLRMNQTVTSERSRIGDRFKATVVTPVYADGVEVVPAGSIVEGRVTRATPARSRGRAGEIGVAFETLVVPDGKSYPIDGALTELQDEDHGEVDAENEVSGRSSDKRKITYIGGGTAGGAILGGIIGGGKGAGIGAAVGAGAGVAGVLFTKGNEAQLRSGTEVGMTTTRPIKFTMRSVR